MAINPVADIVLEVARAADPASRRAAASRLQELSGAPSPAPSPGFDEVSGAAARLPAPAPHLPFDPARALVQLRSAGAPAAWGSSPYERFEAFVMQTFVQSMLPKGDSAMFGSGTSGEIWKSMLAREIGAELARNGGIGIAEMLAESGASANAARQPPLPSPGHDLPTHDNETSS